jgi:hypothetical protein
VTTLNWVIFSLNCVPGLNIHPSLLESNVTEGEPKKKAANWEKVLGWNQESVHDKEIH